jgi:hypothetical protein
LSPNDDPELEGKRDANAAKALHPDVMKELTAIGAYHVANGEKTLSRWTAKMKAELGDEIFDRVKDYLPEVLEGSKIHMRNTEKSVKEAQRAQVAPKPEVLEAQAKSAAANHEELTNRMVYDLACAHIIHGEVGEDALMEATTESEEAVMQAVTKSLNDNGYPDVTENDVRYAFSEYGKVLFPKNDATSREVAETAPKEEPPVADDSGIMRALAEEPAPTKSAGAKSALGEEPTPTSRG